MSFFPTPLIVPSFPQNPIPVNPPNPGSIGATSLHPTVDSNSSKSTSSSLAEQMAVTNETAILNRYRFFRTLDASQETGTIYLRSLVLLIERTKLSCISYIFFLFNYDAIEKVRSHIDSLLMRQDLSTTDKTVELGCLLYYLDYYHSFEIDGESFYLKVKREFDAGLLHLFNKKVGTLEKKRFLLKFCDIAITSDEKVNIGGIMAAINILKTQHHLDFLEERLTLFQVLKNLVKNPALVKLFERPIAKISAESEPFIRRDLNLPDTSRITSLEVKKACFLALIQDLRQDDTGNCFAVAPLIHAIHHGPYKVMEKMFDLISKGFITVEGSVNIPIFSRLASRLRTEQNALQQSLIVAMEFLETNYSNVHENMVSCSLSTQSVPRAVKHNLIDFIKTNLLNKIKLRFPLDIGQYEGYLSFLETYLQKTLWLEHQVEKQVSVEEDQIAIKSRNKTYRIDISEFTGHLDSLKKLIKENRSLCYINQGRYQEIEIVEDFIDVLNEIIALSASDYFGVRTQELEVIYFVQFLCGTLSSFMTREELAKFMRRANFKDFPLLTVYDYFFLGRIFFVQDGGQQSAAPFDFLALNYKEKEIKTASSKEIIAFIAKWILSPPDAFAFHKKHRFPFLCSCNSHAFHLTPYRFNFVWLRAQSQGYDQLIQEHMIAPAEALLAKPITSEEIKRILKNAGFEETWVNFYTSFHSFSNVREFKNAILKNIDERFRKPFIEAFEKTLQSIKIIDIMNSLAGTLLDAYLAKPLGPQKRIAVEESIIAKCLQLGVDSISAPNLARIIKTSLVENAFYDCELYEIEAMIYQFSKMPCVIEIGDLNYADLANQHHTYLVFRYDLIKEDIVLKERTHEHETDFVRDAEPKVIKIFVPTSL